MKVLENINLDQQKKSPSKEVFQSIEKHERMFLLILYHIFRFILRCSDTVFRFQVSTYFQPNWEKKKEKNFSILYKNF
jgi:hypothetical protein